MRLLNKLFFILMGIIFNDVSHAQVDTTWFSNLEYRSLGPNRGGRSNAVCGVEGSRDMFYMGTTGGGVWKTENGGSSWKNISDGFFGGSIGSIAVASSDDNVIYVGQGEETIRGNVSWGEGIWKSEDAGITWKFKGLKNTRHITALTIHPTNPDIVMAAVLGDLYKDTEERGLYRSEDGGDTWNRVLFSSKSAGCNDVAFDPLNHRVVYASTWQVRRTPYSLSSGGEGSALWKSVDGGRNWINFTEKEGLPKGLIGKITVASSSVKKGLVFAMIEHASKGGLYKSQDAGENWKLVNKSAPIRQRAWYFSKVYADTKDAQKVYVMNVRFQKSTDGGKTFKAVRTPHVDHHGLWIDPVDNQRMIVANDGGGQVTYNGGSTWSTYFNQPTEQFYRVSTDNHIPYRIYGAQQDNSTMRLNHITGSWERTAGGESAHIAPDPENPEIVYAGSYGGYLTRYNHETKENRGINVWPDNPMGYGAESMKYRFQWNFPLFFSPHDSRKLYTASNYLHVSTNGGDSWEIISPDLTRNDPEKLKASGGPITKDNTGVEYYCTIFAAVESPLEKDLIYVGSDDGLVHITTDAGINWSNITPKQMPEWTMVNCIEVDPFTKGKVYVVATSYKSGDYHPYLFVSEDYGKSWTSRVEGINTDHFLRALRADKKVANLLYAGTERGMYISYNGGQNWQEFQLNLPIVPITDLVQVKNDLVVATQGRGFYIIDNLDAVRMAGLDTEQKRMTLIGAEDAILDFRNTARLVYMIPDTLKKGESLIIDVLDGEGEVIRSWSSEKTTRDTGKIKVELGVNYFRWNLSYPAAKKPDDMILWWASTRGPKAAPGGYTFRITLSDLVETSDFNISINPNYESDSTEYVAKFKFLNEVVEKIDEMHQAIEDMQKISNQINTFISTHAEIDENDTVMISSQAINQELDSLLNDLYQTKMKSEQDPINYPIKLNNRLAHLNTLVSMGSYGPTSQAVMVKNELIGQIDDRLKRFEEIKQKDIIELNALIHNNILDIITTD
jgi:photosystem II stability/assembly factor-like uncharacterized protein